MRCIFYAKYQIHEEKIHIVVKLLLKKTENALLSFTQVQVVLDQNKPKLNSCQNFWCRFAKQN
jgi:hypothetical protein